MSAVDRTGWVTLQYDGEVGARGGVSVFRMKGVEMRGGDCVEVSPVAARMLLDGAVPGAVKVLKGKPADTVPASPQAKSGQKLVESRAGLSVHFAGAQPVPKPEAAPKPVPVQGRV